MHGHTHTQKYIAKRDMDIDKYTWKNCTKTKKTQQKQQVYKQHAHTILVSSPSAVVCVCVLSIKLRMHARLFLINFYRCLRPVARVAYNVNTRSTRVKCRLRVVSKTKARATHTTTVPFNELISTELSLPLSDEPLYR